MALDFSKATVEVAVPAAAFLGEGPHWDSDLQRLLWIDIYKPSVHIYNPETNKDEEYNIGEKLKALGLTGNRVSIGAVVPYRGSATKLLLATGPYFASYDIATGDITPIHEIEKDKPTNRFNDGKCDPEGRFWAGTMAAQNPDLTLPPEQAALYMMAGGHAAIQTQFTKVSLSNGLAWSNDNKTMYYIDSDKRIMYAFDYNAADGAISNSRVLLNHDESLGFPDGMAIDRDGRLWVAGFGSGQIHCYDPSHPEKVLGSITLPGATNITSCCFGGKNLDEIYVTSASLDKDPLPNAGAVFRITGLGVRGHPGVSYAG